MEAECTFSFQGKLVPNPWFYSCTAYYLGVLPRFLPTRVKGWSIFFNHSLSGMSIQMSITSVAEASAQLRTVISIVISQRNFLMERTVLPSFT